MRKSWTILEVICFIVAGIFAYIGFREPKITASVYFVIAGSLFISGIIIMVGAEIAHILEWSPDADKDTPENFEDRNAKVKIEP